MAKQISKNELDEILLCLSHFSEGVSLTEIHKTLQSLIPRYTLQRRLAHLVKEKKVITIGKARALRYKLATHFLQRKMDAAFISPIPLSTSAESILSAVLKPLQARSPVGYNREFLDRYRPNMTHYLSSTTCQKLFALGRSDGERPAGTYARQILNRLLIDLSWNSSRLEGNTYSLLETERLLNLSEIAEGKDLKEARMILNHKEAIEFLVQSTQEIGINRYTILNLHALLSNDLLADSEASGRLRQIPVGIAQSVYLPLSIPSLVEECFQQVLDTAQAIHDPFEQAFFLMVHLPYLQPFEDVNKRVSRLAANIPLIRRNLCPLSFVDVPQEIYIAALLGVYELNRIELLQDVFIWGYERSCMFYSAIRKELGEPDPFRLRNRALITDTVFTVVHGHMDKTTAVATIRQRANDSLPPTDQARFVEMVEKELLGLHEGNIARHRIRPLEYETWQKFWH